ncbi:MAG: hypothetical protein WC943_10245 [Elusimicrobiota bacterium]|jgi:hypothetical protein
MKTFLGIAILAVVLPAMAASDAAPALVLTSEEQSFLKGCGILQKDIDVFPALALKGQQALKAGILKKNCGDLAIVRFKNARHLVAKYFTDPPPEVRPKWDAKKDPWGPEYVTKAENQYIRDMEEEFISRALAPK